MLVYQRVSFRVKHVGIVILWTLIFGEWIFWLIWLVYFDLCSILKILTVAHERSGHLKVGQQLVPSPKPLVSKPDLITDWLFLRILSGSVRHFFPFSMCFSFNKKPEAWSVFNILTQNHMFPSQKHSSTLKYHLDSVNALKILLCFFKHFGYVKICGAQQICHVLSIHLR